MSQKLIVEGLEPFSGRHCETTALKRALDYHGLSLSEEMLLGLGGGIGFIYWYMKMMPAPFVGGRFGKGADFVTNICRRIGAEVTILETASASKGYEELKVILSTGEPVVVYGDMAYLPYFAIPEVAHFGGHVFTVFGLDEAGDRVHIYDRSRKPVTVTIADLARARGSKFPPFPPKHRLLKIKYQAKRDNQETGIKERSRECCQGGGCRNIGVYSRAPSPWAMWCAVFWPSCQPLKAISPPPAEVAGTVYRHEPAGRSDERVHLYRDRGHRGQRLPPHVCQVPGRSQRNYQ